MLQAQEKINACVDIHLITNVIPTFHKEKLLNFTKIVQEMANAEVVNNNMGAEFWTKVLSKVSVGQPLES